MAIRALKQNIVRPVEILDMGHTDGFVIDGPVKSMSSVSIPLYLFFKYFSRFLCAHYEPA